MLWMITMDKEKLIEGSLWLSGFSLSVILVSQLLLLGWNNHDKGNSTILVIGILLLPVIFYCAYKGLKLILDTIFEK